MSYLMYLFVEIILMAVCLYVVSMCDNSVWAHVVAATALALAMHTCSCGITSLWKDAGVRWTLWRRKREWTRPAAPFWRLVVRCEYASGVAIGYTALISVFTLGPIYGIPMAYSIQQKLAPTAWFQRLRLAFKTAAGFVKAVWQSEECVFAIMSARVRAEELYDYFMHHRGHRLTRFYLAVEPWTRSLQPLAREATRYLRALRLEVQRHRLLLEDDRELKELWIVLTLGLCLLALVLYRILIRKKSFMHAIAISSGVMFAFFIGRDTFVSQVAQRDTFAHSAGGFRLDSITYKLSILDQACHCLDRTLPALAVASCATIMIFIQVVPYALFSWPWRLISWAITALLARGSSPRKPGYNLFRTEKLLKPQRLGTETWQRDLTTERSVRPIIDDHDEYLLAGYSVSSGRPNSGRDEVDPEDYIHAGIQYRSKGLAMPRSTMPNLFPQANLRESQRPTSIVKTE